jgi:hypothetical protein
MDTQGFRQFLQERKFPEDRLQQGVSVAERFEAFVADSRRSGVAGPASGEEVQAFSRLLIQEQLNT